MALISLSLASAVPVEVETSFETITSQINGAKSNLSRFDVERKDRDRVAPRVASAVEDVEDAMFYVSIGHSGVTEKCESSVFVRQRNDVQNHRTTKTRNRSISTINVSTQTFEFISTYSDFRKDVEEERDNRVVDSDTLSAEPLPEVLWHGVDA